MKHTEIIKSCLVAISLLIAPSGEGVFAQSPAFYEPATNSCVLEGWKSSNDDSILDGGVLQLVGNGKETSWNSAPISFESRKLYRLQFKASCVEGGGSDFLCGGTEFANYDFNGLPNVQNPEKPLSFIFLASEGEGGVRTAPVRFRQWETARTYRVGDYRLTPVQPLFKFVSDGAEQPNYLALGDGESFDAEGVYRFTLLHSPDLTNYSRPIFATNAFFNTNRWSLSNEKYVTYRFALEPFSVVDKTAKAEGKIPFVSGKFNVSVGYWICGAAAAEVSVDNENWTKLDEIVGLQAKEVSLTSYLEGKDVDELFVRLRGTDEPGKTSGCNLQVYSVGAEFQTKQDDSRRFQGVGSTLFADLDGAPSDDKSLLDASPVGFDDDDFVWAKKSDGEILRFQWDSDVVKSTMKEEKKPNSSAPLRYEYVAAFKRPVKITRCYYPYFIQDFTNAISGATFIDSKGVGVEASWTNADYRIPRDPKVKKIGAVKPIKISAAKNDFESFQIALCPKNQDLRDVKMELSIPLQSESGATIPSENVNLRYAYYHYVSSPTDATCVQGWYPDALVPISAGADGLGAPLNIEKGFNLPLWVTVKVPADAAPGKYLGVVTIRANDGAYLLTTPFELNVWDFAVPFKGSLQTALGISPNNVWTYHNCKTEAEKRAVYDMYLQLFSDYRISPYTPAPLDPIKVEWTPKTDPPSCRVDFEAFEREMKRVFDKYSFTNFRLPFEGLGGGTFAGRSEGSVAGYAPDRPEYDAMMTEYGRQMQERLRALGLLDAAYVYCFDEPDEKDYEFVANQFARLKKYAPDVQRMLTEEPSEKFSKVLDEKDADVDIWCPVSPNYSNETAKIEREKGNWFWWYICCYPKAPYCTEYIDHPPVELRIWLWQTFEREIAGNLIWETTFWHSPTAFPDSWQNPYEDPMSYTTGYGTPKGAKVPWGNGDGRFVYPPLSAATPGRNDGKVVTDPPCASIRWETMREGIEDYEMLTILKRLVEEKKGELSEARLAEIQKLFDFSEITTDMTRFTNDPQKIYARRAEVAKAIEELK